MKKKRPDLKDLEKLVSSKYAYCWENIGIQLSIPIEKIKCIERDNPNNVMLCCTDMWVHWLQVDTTASWYKVIKVIDSPVISTIMRSFSILSSSVANETHKIVVDLASRLKSKSINDRYRSEDDDWPLHPPKHFTSVALIHHKGRQTEREVLAVATLQKRGDLDLNEISTDDNYFMQSRCTKDISDIFAQVGYSDSKKEIILIEGVPGIGKTVLSKEIVFQWANGNLLTNITLMFLIHLRDTESHKINSFESFVNYVSYSKVAKSIIDYITESKGKNIMIVFDGYDELPEEIRSNSFLSKMMTRSIAEMPFCKVVITSRPHISGHLHDKVDLRIEILGFTNEDRKTYIVDALKDDSSKIDVVMEYLNNNPAVDAYCYIPLNMAILLSFFQNDVSNVIELPKAQTDINEKFICTTISRYIRKTKGLTLNFSHFSEVRTPCDDHEVGTPCIGHKNVVPCCRILKEISKLAFKALKKDKIVFTTADLQETCPCLEESQPENWNGLGLLKGVQFFNFDNTLRHVSFNFLHFTIQEILAAYHITLMSEDDQLQCMKQTFWDNRYYNTWIMYVGLTKKLPIALKHFLSSNRFLISTKILNWWNNDAYCQIAKTITNDKIKCLYLFQCFSEAENNELCQYVGKLLQENKIDLSNQMLSAINLHTLTLFMTKSTTRNWDILNLSNCFIGDNGIKQIYKSFTSNNRTKVCIDTLNLTCNNLTQSSTGLITSLIIQWNIKKMTIDVDWCSCKLNEEIMLQVMQSKIHEDSIFVCDINNYVTIFARLSKLEYLNFSSKSFSKEEIYRITSILTKPQANHSPKLVDINTIIHVLQDCTKIKHLNLSTTQFELSDIAKITRKNTSIECFHLSKMKDPILNRKIKLEMIFDALRTNVSLKHVDMSLITIDSDIVKCVAAVMENNKELKEVNVFKLLLRNNDYQYLKEYLVKFKELKHLSITGCTFSDQDIVNMINVIKNNKNKLESLDLSHCKMPSEKSLEKLFKNSSQVVILKSLNLYNDQLTSNEIGFIFRILKELKLLKFVNLAGNSMQYYSVDDVKYFVNNTQLQELRFPNCVFSHSSLRIIFQAMETISSLQYVDFSTNKIDNELASDVATLFTNNSKLKKLNFATLTLKQTGFQALKKYLVKLKGLKCIKITDCIFTNQDVVYLEMFIGSNHQIQELIICNCKMIGYKMITMTDSIGGYNQLTNLVIHSNNAAVVDYLKHQLAHFLCCCKLRKVVLSNFQLKSNEVKEILMALKHLQHLECADLSGNSMTGDSVDDDVKTTIVNNKQLLKLCLPNCVFIQNDLRIIIQTLQTVSSLQYVDFSTNKCTNELASDVALLITNNSELKEVRFFKLGLNQTGFQHLNRYLEKFTGLQFFRITSCNLSGNTMTSDVVKKTVAMIKNNKNIQSISLPKCILNHNDLRTIIQALQTVSSLQYLNFNTSKFDNELACDVALLISNNSKLKELKIAELSLNHTGFQHLMKHLVKIKGLKLLSITGDDLSSNLMTSHAINEITAMMKNNEHIQSLSILNYAINQSDLRIIIQALQTVSSLQYVDFSTNKCTNELASDVALLITNNSELKEVRFFKLGLNQTGFQHLNRYLEKFTGLQFFRITSCNLSGNTMTSDVVKKTVAMIKNNKNIQSISLPKCILNHNDLRTIIQALQTVSSLQYLNFNTSKFDNELACDVALLISNNSKLKELKIAELSLNHTGFQHLMKHLVKIKGLKLLSITGDDLSSNLMTSHAINEITAMMKNNEHIQSLSILNYAINQSDLRIIIQALQTVSSLQYVDFSTNKCTNELASDVALLITNNSELKEVRFFKLGLNQTGFQHLNRYLEKFTGLQFFRITSCNLSGNTMTSDVVKKTVAMIKNNKNIQSISLPKCILNHNDLRTIIQALQTVSSLQYLNFNTSKFDNELACDVALLISNNSKLKELKIAELSLNHTGFQHLMKHLVKIKGLKLLSITGDDLSSNLMTSHAINEITAMMKNNEHIQSLSILNYAINQSDLRIIIQALQTVSSLQYVDFSTNKFDDKLASDVAALFASNEKLKELRFLESKWFSTPERL